MINIGSFLGNLFLRGKTAERYTSEWWSASNWEPKSITRLDERNLEALEVNVNLKLQRKREEFNVLADSMHIDIDEAAIRGEIQTIMNMDAESLDALEKKIQYKLQEKRKEFNNLLYD